MSADELEAQARAAADGGDVMKAIQLARQAIMIDPARMALLDELAQTYARRDKPPALGQVATEAQQRKDAQAAVAAANQAQQDAIAAAQDVDIPLLSSLSPHAFVAMARRMGEASFEPGEVIVGEGELGDKMYILIEGRAAVHRGGTQLAVLGDGDFFGELALLTAQPRVASVTAVEACRCFTVDNELLKDLSDVYPQVGAIARAFAQQRLGEAALLKSSVFGQLSLKERAELVAKFEHYNLDDGEAVLQEGEGAKGLFLVLAGEVAVVVLDEEVVRLGAGEIVGEISTLFATQATASVIARGEAVVMRLAPADVDEALAPHPALKESLNALGQERWALI
jgi:cAMP-dependent protein kinase regulator